MENVVDSDIKNMIRFGEDSVCEFKSMRILGRRVTEPDAREVADEIVAAANAAGATFLFGVNDKTREIEGVPEDKLEIAETWLRDICNDSVKPLCVKKTSARSTRSTRLNLSPLPLRR